MSFNFAEMNLSNNEVSGGGTILKPGRYVVRIKNPTLKPTKKNDGSRALEIECVDVGGQGSIKAWLNVYIKDSAEATRIGRNQLKSILYYGGYPNPEQPGDVNAVSGLEVGILVKADEYVDGKTGMKRTSSDVAAYFDPAEIDHTRTPKAAPMKKQAVAANGTDSFTRGDDIPF